MTNSYGLARAAVRFLRDETGPTAVEYAVLPAVIVLACAAAVAILEPLAGELLESMGEAIGEYDP